MKMYGLKDEGQTMQMISNNISNSLSAYRRRLSKITDRAASPKNTTPQNAPAPVNPLAAVFALKKKMMEEEERKKQEQDGVEEINDDDLDMKV